MEAQAHESRKYRTSKLLKSSAGLGWSTITAELLRHDAGEIPVTVPQFTEVCLNVVGNDQSVVMRKGAGLHQQAIPSTGTLCLTPIGVGDDVVSLTAPIPQDLHLFLSTSLFERLNDDFNLPASPGRSIRYCAGFRDDVLQEIGLAILAELTNETAEGRMFVETASLTLAARLLQKYCDSGAHKPTDQSTHHLDHRRLRRVLDYIAANIEHDITLDNLARIAGYSSFHFARVFTLAMGVPPHRYISRTRLENAMAELAAGKLPLVEIALNAHFSSQASFTRAFHRVTGMTPKEYQRSRR